MSDTVVNILTRLGILGLAKGATPATQATVSVVDADHNGLDVTVKGAVPLPTGAATSTLQGAGLPAALGAGGGLKVDGSGTALPVSAASLPLPSDAATQTTLAALLAKVIAAPATEAKQDTGNTSLSTLAGIVSAGKALVTETSAASILAKFTAGQAARASSLGVTLSTEDAAKVPALGQALAAGSVPVVLPVAQAGGALALDATLTGGTLRAGVLGADGSAIASSSNGFPVVAQTSSTWDVAANLTRALGYLTGVNLTSAAAANNPVPMQLSSGTVLYTGATAALSLPIVFARSLATTSATLAINGDVIKASAGSALWITITNTTGSSVYWQIHDLASGPPGAGARAAASAPAITANNGSRTGDLIGPTLGLGCNTGILLVLSLSPTTYSAVASNSCSYSIQYI